MPHPTSPFPITHSLPLLALLALTTCTPAPPRSAATPAKQNPNVLSLAGNWRFRLDPSNLGEQQNWQSTALPDHLHLPGSLQEQNFGDPPSPTAHWTARIGLAFLRNPKYQPYEQPNDFKAVSWLTPNRVYVGPAWFQRDITIPDSWAHKHITLFLERPHGQTTLFLDNTKIDSQYSLNTPHTYTLPANLAPGKHTLTLREDNSLQIPIGPDASAVTDQTQTNWNGFIGDLSLHAQNQIRIDDLQLFPDVAHHQVHIKATLINDTGAPVDAEIAAIASPHYENMINGSVRPLGTIHIDKTATAEYDLPNNSTWDEFHPTLSDLHLFLESDGYFASGFKGEIYDSRTVTYGMRNLSTSATQLTINSRPLFLRGTLDCCVFPLTGYPPTDLASWKREFSIIKSFGLNHMRFHSWCPPEAAFQAADELGVYLQVEGPVWAAFGSGNALDKWIPGELERTLKTFGNHPSFCFLSTANEPGSRNNKPNADFLSALVDRWKKEDPRHLYTAGSNWPNVQNADYQVMSPPRMNSSHELNREPATTSDYSAIVSQWKMPIVSHETGQWCVYPNFDEIKKYTGSLHPGNLEIFQDFLKKAGMADQAHDFLMASGHFQAILYKEEIEALLRTPNIGGFQLLDLHDFPGQGTAPVGVLDCFWDEKGYISAKQFSSFCGPVVPLARLPKRVFTSDEIFTAKLQLANYGDTDIRGGARYTLQADDGTIIGGGISDLSVVKAGTLTDIGDAVAFLKSVQAPARITLTLSLNAGEHVNAWQFWVYPPASAATPAPQNIIISPSLDDQTLAALNAGKSVLLLPPTDSLPGNTHGSFSPIFWNRITFPGAAIHTLSILCNPKNPALAQFPTDAYSNWQWADLQNHSHPLILSGPTQPLTPIVQIIDDWDTARKLALVLEANVGKGKLLLSAIDLSSNLDSRPAARQLRTSLLHYMTTKDFHPAATLTPDQLKTLLP
ncbi:MAG TPA: hypothetical protein VHQ47_20810 [Phycisphaerae bacterium]|nr:hypothetical protein [Phycisphaerae bacterium]